MRVERRYLVDLGLGETHLLGQRVKVRRGQTPVGVLDQMQVLDEEIRPPRPVAEQRAHLGSRRVIEVAALGSRASLAAPRLPDAVPLRG